MVAPLAQPPTAPSTDPLTTEHAKPSSTLRFAAELPTHLLHLASSTVVFAMFIHFMPQDADAGLEKFGAMLAAVDMVVCTFALYGAFVGRSTLDFIIPMFILASLWLTALILSALDYVQGGCGLFGYGVLESCAAMRAHIAFEAIAFLLSFLTMVVEFGRRMVPGRGMTRGKKGHVEVIDGREKDVGGVVVTPRTSFTAV